jgi:hypothetical protein
MFVLSPSGQKLAHLRARLKTQNDVGCVFSACGFVFMVRTAIGPQRLFWRCSAAADAPPPPPVPPPPAASSRRRRWSSALTCSKYFPQPAPRIEPVRTATTFGSSMPVSVGRRGTVILLGGKPPTRPLVLCLPCTQLSSSACAVATQTVLVVQPERKWHKTS